MVTMLYMPCYNGYNVINAMLSLLLCCTCHVAIVTMFIHVMLSWLQCCTCHVAIVTMLFMSCCLGYRVHPEMKVYALREEIEQQLGADLVPREYVFLKSVGRSLTRVGLVC